ncbi:uncharacterized protein LOC117653936 isoform X2 [Thrips palmi]|nr:uncharacterized protein LOC117653936 isoform X2 [Thrips palmi]
MNAVTPSKSQLIDDSDILRILLQLSDEQEHEWKPQYPFLDPPTVSRVAQSISNIMARGKPGLRNQLVSLLRQWCTGRYKSDALDHTTWIGRSLSAPECVESLLAVCAPILTNIEDWNKRDAEQQLALCYAMLSAATNSEIQSRLQAGEMCLLLVSHILREKDLTTAHHRFLAQVWNSVGELPIKVEVLINMTERSFLGMEKTLLWLGRKSVGSEGQSAHESLETVIGSTMLRICSLSEVVFQKVCHLLTHMMVVSEAHPGVQALIRAFISKVEVECQTRNEDICALYAEPCQVVSALLCLDPLLLPEQGEDKLSRDSVFQMLHKLPRKTAACLLSHRPSWLLYTF